MFIITKEKDNTPKGFRKLTDKELIKDFLRYDSNDDYSISKNEWIITFIKMLANDMESLEKDGPDSIMKHIKELSSEFDYYDKDKNKYLDYEEYRNIIVNNVLISED